jgi:hypothetical protein
VATRFGRILVRVPFCRRQSLDVLRPGGFPYNARGEARRRRSSETVTTTTDQPRLWQLIGADGQPYESTQPGRIGGHRRSRIYGRLDCPAAMRAIARGGYVSHRVFFADEADAMAAGYRPCARCLPDAYASWKAARADTPPDSCQ